MSKLKLHLWIRYEKICYKPNCVLERLFLSDLGLLLETFVSFKGWVKKE